MINAQSLKKQPYSIDDWAETLSSRELPIFSNTAYNIYQSLEDVNKGAIQLATIILQDPNLTAKLLKISNSSYYNPSRQKISTVSRAIIILGAEVIRELTLACSFFESIISPNNKERANREIAQAIHAVVQAKELAITLHLGLPEEIFVAALLHNIGQIAFWCSQNKQAKQINDLIENKKLDTQEAEKQVLGFTLQDLSTKLSKSWHLGGLIEESLSQHQSNNQRIQIVRMGSEISQAMKAGWESTTMNSCLKKLARLTGEQTDTLIGKVKKNTAVAIKIAQQFGANDASKYMSSEVFVGIEDEFDINQPDKKQIQFQILQDISEHISNRIDLNLLLEMVLEGIHRGIGMDRTLFLLLSPDKHCLKEKIHLGFQNQGLSEKINIFNNESESNLFFHALRQKGGLWVKPENYRSLYTTQIINSTGYNECFIFPVQVEHKSIGLIYADRHLSDTPFIQSDFTTTKHFAKQANIGLTLYTIKRH